MECTLTATSARYSSELTRQRVPVVSRNTPAFSLSASSCFPFMLFLNSRQFCRATAPAARNRTPARVLNIRICKTKETLLNGPQGFSIDWWAFRFSRRRVCCGMLRHRSERRNMPEDRCLQYNLFNVTDLFGNCVWSGVISGVYWVCSLGRTE